MLSMKTAAVSKRAPLQVLTKRASTVGKKKKMKIRRQIDVAGTSVGESAAKRCPSTRTHASNTVNVGEAWT